MSDRDQYRLVSEKPLPNDSRVHREEHLLPGLETAAFLSDWFRDREFAGMKVWVERRKVTDWQRFPS